jgi:mRNA deadenylase 3'-5' endonuclease subunit Ccr4
MGACCASREISSKIYYTQKREYKNVEEGTAGGPEIHVLSYNVLANITATKENFPYAKEEVLQWENRFPKLMAVISRSDADLILL